jgi:hypothetical protein
MTENTAIHERRLTSELQESVKRVVALGRKMGRLYDLARAAGVGVSPPAVHRLSRELFDALPTREGSGISEWRSKASGRVYWSKEVVGFDYGEFGSCGCAYTDEPLVESSEPVANVVEVA